MDKLKIAFLLHAPRFTGGVRVVFDYAQALIALGHEVEVVWSTIPDLAAYHQGTAQDKRQGQLRTLKETLGNLRRGNRLGELNQQAPVRRVHRLNQRTFQPNDVVIATAWHTAYAVQRHLPAHALGLYLIQHHETWDGPKTLVDGSYRLPLEPVVIAPWLKTLLQQQFQRESTLIPNAFNHSQFYPEPTAQPSDRAQRVLMLHHHLPWKGTSDGVTAFEQIRQRHPGARLVMFGLKRDDSVPAYAEFHEAVQGDALRRLYNSCGIFLSTSHQEGWNLPPMEAMACGAAVISTNVGGVPLFGRDGENLLLTPIQDPTALAVQLDQLLSHPERQADLGAAAVQTLQTYRWSDSAQQLQELIQQQRANRRSDSPFAFKSN